jgi:peptidyl-prolyl cis-trans isomerase SurA
MFVSRALLILALAGFAVTAHATDLTKIAAVVNDAAISMDDLNNRIRLAEVASNIPDSPETRARLTQQILRTLVDEQLELQEAKKQGIDIDDKDVDTSFARVAEQNKMTAQQFTDVLAKQGVAVDTVKSQIKAQLAWVKVVQKVIRPRIDIPDQDIDEALARLKSNAGKPQYLAAEIFLAVDTPDQEAAVHANADKLVEQLRQGGNFALAARQFSQSAGAATGGDLGWVQQGQLPPDQEAALAKLRPGEISDPVLDSSGYHIFILRERGTVAGPDANAVKLRLLQLVILAKSATPEAFAAALGKATMLAGDIKGCDAAHAQAQAQNDGTSGDLGEIVLSQLPPTMVNAVQDLPIGQFTQPLKTSKGYLLLMVCERNVPDTVLPDRDEMANQIGYQRLDLQQRRYLRDLRASAFVDIRI